MNRLVIILAGVVLLGDCGITGMHLLRLKLHSTHSGATHTSTPGYVGQRPPALSFESWRPDAAQTEQQPSATSAASTQVRGRSDSLLSIASECSVCTETQEAVLEEEAEDVVNLVLVRPEGALAACAHEPGEPQTGDLPLLSCTHNDEICRTCLIDWLERDQRQNGKRTCPLCRAPALEPKQPLITRLEQMRLEAAQVFDAFLCSAPRH